MVPLSYLKARDLYVQTSLIATTRVCYECHPVGGSTDREAGLTQTGKPPWGGKGGPGAERGSRSSRPGLPKVCRCAVGAAPPQLSSRHGTGAPVTRSMRGRGAAPVRAPGVSRRAGRLDREAAPLVVPAGPLAELVRASSPAPRPASAAWRSAVRARPARAARSRSGAARSVRPAPPARSRPRRGGGGGLGEALLRGHRGSILSCSGADNRSTDKRPLPS